MARVTQKAVNRTYQYGYSQNLSAYNKSINKMNTGRSFSKVSENVTSAARAYKVRKALSRDNQYIENIEDLADRVEAVEDNLTSINSWIQTVKDRIVQARGTTTQDEYEVIASEIENLADNVIQAINRENTGRFVFGGNENKAPFTVKVENGKHVVYFKDTGKEVSKIDKRSDVETDVYADIGAGMSFDANGNLDISSVAKITYSGLECLGYGQEEYEGKKFDKNIISLFYDIADTIRSGDRDAMAKCEGFLNKRYNEYVVNLTNIGVTSNFLEQSKTNIEKEIDALTERQNNLEAVDYAEEAITSQTFYMAYQVSIQMGSKILPNSIFSFI